MGQQAKVRVTLKAESLRKRREQKGEASFPSARRFHLQRRQSLIGNKSKLGERFQPFPENLGPWEQAADCSKKAS